MDSHPEQAQARPARGVLIAAPSSGSGKTTVTLGLLRHLRNTGIQIASAKVGPDYIDPAFHCAASARPCINLDAWAMRRNTLATLIANLDRDTELVICEGVMGLFDGAPDGTGSTADLARLSGWPVVLVVDASGMAASAAALVRGFATHQSNVIISGVIFNRVGSRSHAELLREACAPLGLPVLGALPRAAELSLPDRHLGLVQAQEHPSLEEFLERAAWWVSEHVDVHVLRALARPTCLGRNVDEGPILPVLGQRIAVARDVAFGFAYPFVLEGWRRAGAEVIPFSPLADESPPSQADAIYLPGGYPELHAGKLSDNRRFRAGVVEAARRGVTIYGECGGYMALGQTLTDARGGCYSMTGLLPVETSFTEPKLTLGYRRVKTLGSDPFGRPGARFRGHEFHFARVVSEGAESRLFRCYDSVERDIGGIGCRVGSVMGSFVHLVDCEN